MILWRIGSTSSRVLGAVLSLVGGCWRCGSATSPRVDGLDSGAQDGLLGGLTWGSGSHGCDLDPRSDNSAVWTLSRKAERPQAGKQATLLVPYGRQLERR